MIGTVATCSRLRELRVGYDDASRFSREYKRHFGEPQGATSNDCGSSTNVASFCVLLSDSPGAPCPPMTAPSTLSARGWTRGPGLGTSRWAWRGRAMTSSSPDTTRRAGGRPSARAGWNALLRARPALGLGGHTVARGPERGVGGAHEGGNELISLHRLDLAGAPNPRRAWRRVQVVRPLQWEFVSPILRDPQWRLAGDMTGGHAGPSVGGLGLLTRSTTTALQG